MIAVRQKLRNMGVGKRLVEFVEVLASKNNRNIFLICSSENSGASNFYKKIGFEETGVLKDLVMQGHDEILFRKRLL